MVRPHKELLRSDVILVSDTSMLGWDVPSITCGLRGLCYVQVTVTGPDRDLHSGLYGGAVADPAVVLSKMIASLTDADGRVTVPGFYDRVRELSPAERTDFGRAPFCEAAFCKSIGVRETAGEKGYSTMERIGVRPSLDVNGIWGGYTGEGAKTIIPSKAHAKISMRLVPDQDYREIGRLFAEHFRSIAPRSVRVDVEVLHGGFPYVCPTDLPAYRARCPGPSSGRSAGSLCRTIRAAASRSSARSRRSWASSRFCSDSGSTATRSTRRTRATDLRTSCAASRRSSGSTASSRQAGERCRAGLQVWS